MKISNLVVAVVLAAIPGSALAGEKGEHQKMKFPVAAAEFRAKVSARQSKHKARLEQFLTEKKIPAEKAKEIRERAAQNEAKVNAKVSEVIKDGTVTADEAKEVREIARAGRPHHKHGGHGKKHEKK